MDDATRDGRSLTGLQSGMLRGLEADIRNVAGDLQEPVAELRAGGSQVAASSVAGSGNCFRSLLSDEGQPGRYSTQRVTRPGASGD